MSTVIYKQIHDKMIFFDNYPDKVSPKEVKKLLASSLKFFPWEHWCLVFMKRILVEMSLHTMTCHTRTLKPEVDIYCKDILIWHFRMIKQFSPVACVSALFPYRHQLFPQTYACSEVRKHMKTLYQACRIYQPVSSVETVQWLSFIKDNSILAKQMKICAFCAKFTQAVENICSGCKAVSYCNRACQTSDWKLHKITCGQLMLIAKDL